MVFQTPRHTIYSMRFLRKIRDQKDTLDPLKNMALGGYQDITCFMHISCLTNGG